MFSPIMRVLTAVAVAFIVALGGILLVISIILNETEEISSNADTINTSSGQRGTNGLITFKIDQSPFTGFCYEYLDPIRGRGSSAVQIDCELYESIIQGDSRNR